MPLLFLVVSGDGIILLPLHPRSMVLGFNLHILSCKLSDKHSHDTFYVEISLSVSIQF